MTTSRLITVIVFSAFVLASATPGAAERRSDSPPTAAPATSAPTPTIAPAYGWPVKPFHAQHPVRGFFGDPRVSGASHAFHSGIDVSAADGTPVYATITGTVRILDAYPQTVSILVEGGRIQFQYWHVVPAVETGMRVTAYETVIGHIARGWGHVHFSDLRRGVYVNPLRPGALGPYEDETAPAIRSLSIIDRSLMVTIDDETPVPVHGAWRDRPVAPTLVTWRVFDAAGAEAITTQTTADFRVTIPHRTEYGRVYSPQTRQNKKHRNGRYAFRLAELETLGLSPGTYTIEIVATDVRGNSTPLRRPLVVRATGDPNSSFMSLH